MPKFVYPNSFGGKKQLFDRAFEYYRMLNYQGMKSFLSTQDDVRKGLEMIFQKVVNDDIEDVDCKGCFIVNTTTEFLPEDENLQEVIRLHKVSNEKVFYDFMKKGVENGQIAKHKDLKTISSLLFTLMMGLRVVNKTRPKKEESMASVYAVLSLLDD